MLDRQIALIRNRDAEDERARDLEAAGLNGLDLVIVSLGPPVGPDEALLELHFFNALHLADMLADFGGDPALAADMFRVRGGHRVRGGLGAGEVRCTAVAAGPTPDSLTLTLSPIGDYSTYRLELIFDPARIDPFFAELAFKFRPGCFTDDCAPAGARGTAAKPAPAIDYLAKDYDSFRHTLITSMMERVPGWQVSSEADLDQTLIDLFAAAGDELSDFQDRVMNEAYLATARKRVSLARHARLVDYHVHEGNQASTWLVVTLDEAAPPLVPDAELVTWAGHPDAPDRWVRFASRETALPAAERVELQPLLNALDLHSWSDARPALPAGAISADLVPALVGAGQAEAETVRDLIVAGRLRRLVLAELLNPRTGRAGGRDPRKRQILTLLPDASVMHDPLTDRWIVRVRWRDEDRLTRDYGFVTFCPDGRVDGVSRFFGNVVEVHEGRPVEARFYEPGAFLPVDSETVAHRHFARRMLYGEPRGLLCELPFMPLAYRATPLGGVVPARSTLAVEVDLPGGGTDPWDEVPSLVHSDDSAEEGDHFVVETDELRQSRLRFGNGVNGRLPFEGVVIRCRFQSGGGRRGNIGADSLTQFQPLPIPNELAIASVWNPFDVTGGRDPEPAAQVVRKAPEAYRAHQLRAVTLADYRHRAEEVPGVARAAARYAWTGSWRTVRIVLDPVGTTQLSPELRADVAAHLESVRLIGEDLEIRPPRFVPLTVEVALCIHPGYWPEDVRWVLEEEFSDGFTADGRPGFFHPDSWTFGQSLHRSEIAGRVHAVAGVEHVISIGMRRFDATSAGGPGQAALTAAFDEIFLVRNDPDHMERGSIRFDIQGGQR